MELEEGSDEVIHGGEETRRLKKDDDERAEDIKRLIDPRKPTKEEVDLHDLFHLPYRNWCPVCVKAKGKELDHRKSAEEPRGLSEYAFDYCFPGDEFGFKLTVLSGNEKFTGMHFSTAVPTKGASGKFASDKTVEFMEEIGDRATKVIIKSDQEPSIQYLVKDVIESRPEGQTVVEESPVKSSGSNGMVERGVQGLEGQLRVMLLALERRIGRELSARESIITFMPEYAAYLMNRKEVGKDGKTAYERCKGKKATVLGIEFGEKLLYKVKAQTKQEKINSRWEYGIFIGVRRRSGELWIAIKDKVFAVRSVRRIPIEDRWGEDSVKWVNRAPWNRYKGEEYADGDLPEEVEVAVNPAKAYEGPVFIQTRERPPREFYIKKSDAETHGYTRGCGGCSSWSRGLARQPHTEECRIRFKALLKDQARVINAEERKKDFETREVEKRRKKDDKKEEKKKRKAEDGDDGDQDDRFKSQEASSSSSGLKRKPEDYPEGEEMRLEIIEEDTVKSWVCEIEDAIKEESPVEEEEEGEKAWDDVKDIELDVREVRKARKEEVGYMENRTIWTVKPETECWERLGKPPVSVRWVDTLKSDGVRSRLVARDFKGGDKDRDDLFAATPPLESKRLLISRAATRVKGRLTRKLLFIDAKKAHLNPRCKEDVYIQLPEEAEGGAGKCGKLNFWLYGFRPAAQAWENHYAEKFEGAGFKRGEACAVIFYHTERDLSCAVHGDDFTFCGEEEDLVWITEEMRGWFEIKVRATLGPDDGDDKEVIILGRKVSWKPWGIEWEADEKHREKLMEKFGYDEKTKPLNHNGESADHQDESWEEEKLKKEEATEFRGAAARLNFLSQDSPELMYPAKEISTEMAEPVRGGWKRLKKVSRFLKGREAVIWEFPWQDECQELHAYGDSDWGGRRGSRKSTSGGLVMLGRHCIKTWSSTQGAVALSSAEAEFYAMIEAIIRAKGVLNVMREIGFDPYDHIQLFTDSSAAKSFVSRKGLGKMKHLEIRDLWLQREVGLGKVVVNKVEGPKNPADLMTKYLKRWEIDLRLKLMGIRVKWSEPLQGEKV